MAKSIFQRIADKIEAFDPRWLKDILTIVRTLLRVGLKALSDDATSYLRTAIISEATKDISGTDKCKNVIKGFRERYTTINITNSMLTTIISALVEVLKDERHLP